jgi:predicted DCC family thiol-disulfide oxidoreductase YuxK
MVTAREVILYDADCGFCRWCVSKVLAWDRRRRLVPMALQDPRANRLLAGMPPEVRWSSWHLASASGEPRSAGMAAVSLLRLLPGGRVPAALAAAAPGMTERLYRFVADRRATLGRIVTSGARRRALARIASRTPTDSFVPTGAGGATCAR